MSSPMYELPKHLPMSLNANNQGPASLEDTVAWECWCPDGPRCEVFVNAIWTINWDQFGAEDA